MHTSLLVHTPTHNTYMRTYLTFTYAKSKLTSFFFFCFCFCFARIISSYPSALFLLLPQVYCVPFGTFNPSCSCYLNMHFLLSEPPCSLQDYAIQNMAHARGDPHSWHLLDPIITCTLWDELFVFICGLNPTHIHLTSVFPW